MPPIRFTPKAKSKPSEADSIWRGGATKRYAVFRWPPKEPPGNGASAVCSDMVRVARRELAASSSQSPVKTYT